MISASRRSSGSCWTPSRMRASSSRPSTRSSVVCSVRERARVVDRRLRPARAVAVVVGREVVGDADQPRAQRPALGLALRALEVPVGLQERLLGEVLGVVVVADPVVRVGVDVAQVRPVEVGEVRVELRLPRGGSCRGHGHGGYISPSGGAARACLGLLLRRGQRRRDQRPGSTRPSMSPASDREDRRVDAGLAQRAASSGTRVDGLGGLAERRARSRAPACPAEQLAGAAVARAAARTVATRSPAPARPANVSGWSRTRRAYASTSANTLPAAAPAAFGPAPPAAAAASAAAFLAQPASSTPITSVVVATSKPAAASASPSWRANAAVRAWRARARRRRRARPRRARAAQRADGPRRHALGDEGGRQRAERRARGPWTARARRRAARSRRRGRRPWRAARRRDGEADEIVARQLEVGGAHDVHARGQLDAGQVVLVHARGARAASACSACGSRGRPRGPRGRA